MRFALRPLWATRVRGHVVAASFVLIAAACGGSGAADTVQSTAPASAEQPAATAAPATASPNTATPNTATQDTATQGAAPEPDATEADAAEPAATEPAAPVAATVELPAVDVVNLLTGETVNLASQAEPGATLLWFWAPH